MNTWHIYRLSDGVFTGQAYTGAEADLEANTPAGCGAIVGVSDWLSQRVDTPTGALVDYQPPAPADDAMRTWSWAAAAKRWVAAPTVAALSIAARAERDRRLSASDWVTLRALDAGEPVPTAWRDYRQALRDIAAQAGFPTSITWPEEPTE